MEFKEIYTTEEIDEIIEWYNTHTFDNDLDIGSGIHFKKLDKTLPQLFYTAHHRRENRNFAGPINLMFRIREELIKQNKVKDGLVS